MGLGDLVVAAAANNSLKKILKAKFREERPVPWLDEKSYLRVSGLADLCPREEVICSTRLIPRSRVVEVDLNLIFGHGTALHWGLQNKILPSTDALVGIWRCADCAKEYGSLDGKVQVSQTLVRQPTKCSACDGIDFHYREQHFINEEYRIGGHPDGFLVLPALPGIGILECKSISSRRAWEIKNVPNMGHVIQTQAYMWLTDLKWAKILYWDKGGMGLSALTEHTIERDENCINIIKSNIRSIWDGIAADMMPARICDQVECPRAKACSVAKLCFETGT
jgi:hypothetical protein